MFPNDPLVLMQAPAWVALATLPLLVLANWQLARIPREAGSLAPPWMARLFSVLLALSLLAGLSNARSGPDLPGTLHALATTVLALCALRITWRVDRGRLGFSDMRFVLAYLVCEASRLLFFSPPEASGASLLLLLLLLAPSLPLSRMGHDWFAYRVGALALFLALCQWPAFNAWVHTTLPLPLATVIADLRQGLPTLFGLCLELACVAWVVQCRFSEWPHARLGPKESGPRVTSRLALQPKRGG
jgi:hypothetical protein